MCSSPLARTSPGIIARMGKLGFHTSRPWHQGQRFCLAWVEGRRLSSALSSVIGKQTLANHLGDFNSSS
jgi:hypothetical protein